MKKFKIYTYRTRCFNYEISDDVIEKIKNYPYTSQSQELLNNDLLNFFKNNYNKLKNKVKVNIVQANSWTDAICIIKYRSNYKERIGLDYFWEEIENETI